jgi:hypothetical protein
VLFSEEGYVLRAISISVEDAKSLSSRNEHQNGWVLTTNQSLLYHNNVIDITNGLNAILGIEPPAPVVRSKAGKGKALDPIQGEHSIASQKPIIEYYVAGKKVMSNVFAEALSQSKMALRTVYYSDGSSKTTEWDAKSFTSESNLSHNIYSGPLRNWPSKGIVKLVLETE